MDKKERYMQQSNETQVSVEKREEKDYLYINMWLLLMLPGLVLFGIINVFPQLLETDTFLILTLAGIALTEGCHQCIRLAMKPGAQQSRIVAWFVFFLSLLSVVIGVVAVYNDIKIIAV